MAPYATRPQSVTPKRPLTRRAHWALVTAALLTATAGCLDARQRPGDDPGAAGPRVAVAKWFEMDATEQDGVTTAISVTSPTGWTTTGSTSR